VLNNLQRQRQPWCGRPLRTGAGPRRARAAGSLTPWFPPLTATETLDSGRQRAPPVSRTLTRTTPKSLSTNGMRPATERAGYDARQRRRDAGLGDPGDDLTSGGRPRGRPHL
jgi:hypothetical protein